MIMLDCHDLMSISSIQSIFREVLILQSPRKRLVLEMEARVN